MDGDGDGMRAAPSPSSASNLPTFFRWCLGGMSAFASNPASARVADAGVGEVQHLFKSLAAECGPITASQDDLLVVSPFVGSGEVEEEVEEAAEVFSTPPLTQRDPQRRQQQSQGRAGDGEEDGITMCTMPFTQPSAPSPASSSSPSSESSERFRLKPRKPRICTRKIRGGANKIRTPTPSPTKPSPSPSTKPGPHPGPGPGPAPGPELDPLAKIVLMIPCDPLPTSGYGDILELARSRGIF